MTGCGGSTPTGLASSPYARCAIFALAIAAALTLICVGSATAQAATFVVSSTADTGGTGACATSGSCTLRQAINTANANTNSPTIDLIHFSSGGTIAIGSPLPAPTEPLKIDAQSNVILVQGVGYSCVTSPFVLDLSGATRLEVHGVTFSGVCDQPIDNAAHDAPTIHIGPRRGDGTLPVSGTAPGGATSVDIYKANGIGDHEPSEFLATVPASGGTYAYVPSPPLAPTDRVTATYTDANSTSQFAARVGFPPDVASPLLLRSVAVSNSTIRLDFNETITQSSLAPTDFRLIMAGVARNIVSATAFANSVFLGVSDPWQTGEAGAVGLNGVGAIADVSGNEIFGGPGSRVYAAAGVIDPPQIASMTIRPSRICKKKTRHCRRTATRVRVAVNQDITWSATISRLRGGRAREIVSFRHKLKAGVTSFKIKNKVEGRRLPRGRMLLTAVATNVMLTDSAPAHAVFNVK